MARLRMLVAYSMSSTHVSTTRAYLEALAQYIDFDVSYVHVTHEAVLDVDENDYDIVFHNYCGRLCFPGYLSDSYREWIKKFNGLKVVAIQDEYDFTNATKANIKDLGFQVVLTCVPQDQLEYVYPKAEFPGVTFVTVLTGYVSDQSPIDFPIVPLSQRPIHVGYRGNMLPARYGRLGFEKFDIGRRVKIACEEKGIPHDIAMDNASRIYGRKWFEFIGSCRAILGAESGCNAFDFDGSLDRSLKALEAEKGRPITYDEFKHQIGDRENYVSMGQISPRVFEAAAMRTPMILFRGKYSGLIEPETHYIALEKDYSNIDEVLSRLSDVQALESMASRAYDELVSSKKYTYKAYGKFLEKLLTERYSALGSKLGTRLTCRTSDASPEMGLEDFLRRQRPTTSPRGIAYLNWAYYRGARDKLQKEVDRLWKVYDELCGHALPWAITNSKAYANQYRFLTSAQRRKPAVADLPDALPIGPMVEIDRNATAFRKTVYQAAPSVECTIPDAENIDAAAADEERIFEEQRAIIAEITTYIEGLQKEFNRYCDLSTKHFNTLNSVMTSSFSAYFPLAVLRRIKAAIVRKLLAN